MMKKLASSLFALMLCVSLFAAPGAAFAAGQTGDYVFDERGLFTSDEFAALEASGAELAGKYDMGVYFLTTGYMDGLSDPTSSQRTSYATTYYKEHGLGLNSGSGGYGDGIMLVIAADSRDYVTIAYGQGSYSFSDGGIDAMEDAVLDNIRDHRDDWYGAATTYYDQIGRQLDYYDRHGDALEPLDAFDWAFRIFIIVGIPLIVTFVVIRSWRGAMKSAVEQSEAGNYLDRESLNVTRANDRFVNTTLVATPKPKDNDNGGGGGGFSSSGGGKF